ncbi:hypothetical protein BN000_05759 [Mycobacterium europaeum]|uniref:Uncharacterized protein n=1 Tax=Mycobacterium europaeum TaxID=761804 RepID=A0A0U1DU29_9MYCO|nr:hypothetical protein BN000_05759 [Mycobacterium europaeum]
MTVAGRPVADVAFWALVANLRRDLRGQSDANKLIPAEVASLPR